MLKLNIDKNEFKLIRKEFENNVENDQNIRLLDTFYEIDGNNELGEYKLRSKKKIEEKMNVIILKIAFIILS